MIHNIQLIQFRCFDKNVFEFDPAITYIYGPNGSGKTSILEAIYLIASGKSHRTTDDKNLIKNDKPFCKIIIESNTHTYEMVITSKGKRVWIDQSEKRKLSQFIGQLKAVIFSPEDIELIKGSPLGKRQFMDVSMVQVDNTYLDTLSTYRKLIKQRNALLKKIDVDNDLTFLTIVTEQVAQYGKLIIQAREKFINELNQEFQLIYQAMNDKQVEIKYKPNVSHNDIEKQLTQTLKTDILTNQTNTGPHRDDLIITFASGLAKDKASQGQQRLIAVSIKLAELQLIKRHTKEEVILLLDDVLSELDEEKQKLILSYREEKQQTIINSAIPYHLEKGKDIALEGVNYE